MFTIKNQRTQKTNEYFFPTEAEATAFVLMAKTKTQAAINSDVVLSQTIIEGLFNPNGQPMLASLAQASFWGEKYSVVEVATITINNVAIENHLADDSDCYGGELNLFAFVCKTVAERIVSGEIVTSAKINGEEMERVSLANIFNGFGGEDFTKLPYEVALGVLFGDYDMTPHAVTSLPSALKSVIYAAQSVVSERLQTLEKLAEMLKSI